MLLAFLFAAAGLATSYAAWLTTSSTPQRVILDFEDGVRGQVLDDEYTEMGVRVSAVNWSHGPDVAALFDSEFVTGSDEDLEGPIPPGQGFEALGELHPGKVLILHERHDCTNGVCIEPDDEGGRPAGWLEFVFSEPVTLVQLDVLDVTYEDGETPSRLVLYGTDGVLPGEWSVPDVGNHRWGRWQVGAGGVIRARLYLPGDGAVDNIVFERPSEPVNWAPEIVSQPVIGVRAAEPYAYALDVTDADGDAVTYSLLTAPTGMYVTPEGVLRWTPSSTDVGLHAVEIGVNDGRGGVARQAFTLSVSNEALFFTLDFEDLDLGQIVDREYINRSVSIYAKNLSSGSDYAVVFDTNQPTGGDTDLTAPFEEEEDFAVGIGDLDPGKVLILHEEHDCDVEDQYCLEPDDETTRPAGWIEFRFAQPVHVSSLDVFDITSDNPAARMVELFDADDQPVSSGLVLPYTGSSDWARLVIDTQGVRRMRVNLDGDGALDNLVYSLDPLGIPSEPGPPVIAFASPEEGSLLTDRRPALILDVLQPGGGVEASTVAVMANGQFLVVTCALVGIQLDCTLQADLPEGEVDLTAAVQDAVGRLSNTASVHITVGTAPPPVDGGPTGGWREADPVTLPPLPPPPDYTGYPTTPEGVPIIGSSPTLVLTPRAEPDAITARDLCAALVAECFQPGERSMDACFRSAPLCGTDRPWEEDACCAPSCYERYANERRAGTDPIGAYLHVLFDTPRCMPGVDAMLAEVTP